MGVLNFEKKPNVVVNSLLDHIIGKVNARKRPYKDSPSVWLKKKG